MDENGCIVYQYYHPININPPLGPIEILEAVLNGAQVIIMQTNASE